jgi:hypothetical protein
VPSVVVAVEVVLVAGRPFETHGFADVLVAVFGAIVGATPDAVPGGIVGASAGATPGSVVFRFGEELRTARSPTTSTTAMTATIAMTVDCLFMRDEGCIRRARVEGSV